MDCWELKKVRKRKPIKGDFMSEVYSDFKTFE